MSTPRNIHDAEQVVAALANIAGGLAAAYRELTTNGVPELHAARIVAAMGASLTRVPRA